MRKHIVHQSTKVSVNRRNGSVCSCSAFLHNLQEKRLQKRMKNRYAVACFHIRKYLHPLKLKTMYKYCVGLAYIMMNISWSTLRRYRNGSVKETRECLQGQLTRSHFSCLKAELRTTSRVGPWSSGTDLLLWYSNRLDAVIETVNITKYRYYMSQYIYIMCHLNREKQVETIRSILCCCGWLLLCGHLWSKNFYSNIL